MLERSVVTALSKSSSVNKHGFSALILEGTVVKACGIARSSPSCDSSVWQKYTSSFCLLTAPLAFPPCDLPPFPSYASGQFARMLSPAEVFVLCMSAFGYFWIAVAIVLILALVTYVCFTAFRQLVHKLYRKLKLLYWPETTFRFLDLSPEIRLIVYAYTLPEDRIYYMTARNMRVYTKAQKELIVDEVAQPLPALLRVCRLVRQELRLMVYENNCFYITIYSIRDLLHTMELLNNSTCSSPFYFMNGSQMMKHVRIRVDELIIDLRSIHSNDTLFVLQFSESSPIWFGPGKSLRRSRTDMARMIKAYARAVRFWISVRDVSDLLRCILVDSASDPIVLNRLLPWYHRGRKAPISRLPPV
ncbi:hypothetical protein D6C99_09020 [Aureobasidium pullulans]|nr:hypothetical protein D6C99_09020 [Aureobasidium pullulans]